MWQWQETHTWEWRNAHDTLQLFQHSKKIKKKKKGSFGAGAGGGQVGHGGPSQLPV